MSKVRALRVHVINTEPSDTDLGLGQYEPLLMDVSSDTHRRPTLLEDARLLPPYDALRRSSSGLLRLSSTDGIVTGTDLALTEDPRRVDLHRKCCRRERFCRDWDDSSDDSVPGPLTLYDQFRRRGFPAADTPEVVPESDTDTRRSYLAQALRVHTRRDGFAESLPTVNLPTVENCSMRRQRYAISPEERDNFPLRDFDSMQEVDKLHDDERSTLEMDDRRLTPAELASRRAREARRNYARLSSDDGFLVSSDDEFDLDMQYSGASAETFRKILLSILPMATLEPEV